jgi:hypothetical protein
MFSPIDQMPAAMPAIREQDPARDLHAQTAIMLFRPAGTALRANRFVVAPFPKAAADLDLVFRQQTVHANPGDPKDGRSNVRPRSIWPRHAAIKLTGSVGISASHRVMAVSIFALPKSRRCLPMSFLARSSVIPAPR